MKKKKLLQPNKKKNESTNFFELVYDLAKEIPKGRVTSYGAIAKALGAKSSARMVGWAMSSCHLNQPNVPAHRVVNRLGILSGKHHFPKNNSMEKQLKKEGIKVENDKVVNFKKIFWDPLLEY